MKVWYFGYKAGYGHGMIPGRYADDSLDFMAKNPLAFCLDGGLCPKTNGYEDEGVANIARKDGWTAIAFWDRSGDKRHASNSAFLFNDERIGFDAAIAIAKQEFPQIFTRFGFEIREFSNA